MAGVHYISVPASDELFAAIEAAGKKKGVKVGPKAALDLERVYKVGRFAKVEKAAK